MTTARFPVRFDSTASTLGSRTGDEVLERRLARETEHDRAAAAEREHALEREAEVASNRSEVGRPKILFSGIEVSQKAKKLAAIDGASEAKSTADATHVIAASTERKGELRATLYCYFKVCYEIRRLLTKAYSPSTKLSIHHFMGPIQWRSGARPRS